MSKSILLIFVVGLLWLEPQISKAQVKISQPETVGRFNVDQHNDQQLSSVGLKIKRDFSQVGGIEVKNHIKALSLSAPNGIRIRSFDLDKVNNIVVGTTSPHSTVDINLVRDGNQGKEIVILIRNPDGSVKATDKNDVGVFDLNGIPQKFTIKSFPASNVKVRFDILVDRSGSMAHVIAKVRTAITLLMDRLPKKARCRVTSFNDTYVRHSKNYQPCMSRLHKINTIKAGGDTDIYQPLFDTYTELERLKDELTAVVIITDGVGSSNISREKMMRRKSSPTYVYWLGDYEEKRLKGIADTFIYGRKDVGRLLKNYVQRIGNAVSHQQVISTNP